MKVTQQTLPLFNEMYELKFSESEMQNAFSVRDKLVKSIKKLNKKFKTTSVSNIVHTIDNGTNKILHTMYITDEWEGRLEIYAGAKDKEPADKKETSLPVPITNSYFVLNPAYLVNTSNYSISVKSIDAEKLFELLENLHVCSKLGIVALDKDEVNTLTAQLSPTPENLTPALNDLTWLLEVTSGQSIFEKLKAGRLRMDSRINSQYQFSESTDELKEWLLHLVPGAKITDSSGAVSENNMRSLGKLEREMAVGYIQSVLEYDNHRFGISNVFYTDYYQASSFRKIFLLNHEDELFNYADIDRVSIYNKTYYWRQESTAISRDKALGRMVFTETVTLPQREVLTWIYRHTTEKETQLCDAAQLKLLIKKFSEETRRAKEDEKERELLEKKLKEKIESIKTGKKLILNGMTITKDSIEYEGQSLTRTDKPDWVHQTLLHLTRIYKFDDINWDSVFEHFIGNVSSASSKGSIGDVSFDLVYTESKNSAGIISTRTTLNDYRINKNELLDCLRRAVCYTNQDDFDEFLANVSSCSLKFHRYLQTGIDFEVSGMRYNEGFSFKLPLERRKNIMYIVLGDNEYKVRDTNRLINMQNIRDLGEIMELLLGDKVIEGMTIDDAKAVLKLAKIEFQSAVDKSKKLLDETEKTLKLVRQENIQMGSVTVKDGYVVNGKLRQYVVANTEKCEVYEYPTGRYICIVDKSTSQVGKDKLVNRLYALVNDQALAQDIHTLN